MRSRLTISTSLAAVALLAAAGVAEAGPPGKWSQVTGMGRPDINIMEVGKARTPDGVLHVSWTSEGDGNAASVLHSAVSKDAKTVSGPNAIATFPGGMNEGSALVAEPGGLRVFFAGLAAGSPLSDSMSTATSPNGATWTVQPTPASFAGDKSSVYAGKGISAVRRADGTLFSAWGDSAPGQGGIHVGLSGATPDFPFGSPCCNVDPGLAVDGASGQVVAAWNVAGEDRMHAQGIAPAGPRLTLPNSDAAQLQQRVGVSGRIGAPGVYVAYTSGTNPFLGKATLWRVGDAKAKVLSGKKGAQDTNIAQGPSGRLWAFWDRAGRIYATRSNKAVTRWGAIVVVKPLKGASISRLHGEGSRGPLDLLAHMDPSSGPLATYHQRVLPGLTLTVTKKRKNGKVTFKVTDAGAPVKGAKVKVKGESGKAKASGKLTLDLGDGGRFKAKATKKGYAPASKRGRLP